MKRVREFSTGFHVLDEFIGFSNGQLILVASRPNIGKTAFALSMIQNLCVNQQLSVALFLPQMSRDPIVCSMIAALAGIDTTSTHHKTITQEGLEEVSVALELLSNANLYIDNTPYLSTVELRTKAHILKQEHDIDIIFIDYLQLMEYIGTAKSRAIQLLGISADLKELAVTLDIPVVVLSQFDRHSSRRKDFSPRCSDFNELGSYDDVCSIFDIVIQLHREEYYRPTEENRGLAEVWVFKNIHPPVGSATLRFLPEKNAFMDLLPLEKDLVLPNIISTCNNEIKLWLAKHPQNLRNVPPRLFEEIIADMFSSQGYEVKLTAQTRDGGVDLIAVRKQWPDEFRLVVECKRYAERQAVGVQAVRGMLFLLEKFQADRAILATTSYFSKDAWLESQHPSLWRVSLRDFNALCEWFREYYDWLKQNRRYL